MLAAGFWLVMAFVVFVVLEHRQAGLVQGWAAIVMGVLSGSVPWYTMMVLGKKISVFQKVDDTLAVFHTHAVAGLLGVVLTGLFAEPQLSTLFLPVTNSKGGVYGGSGGVQILKQIVGALFIIGWNIVATSIICLVISFIVPLRMTEEELLIGDDAVHMGKKLMLYGVMERNLVSTKMILHNMAWLQVVSLKLSRYHMRKFNMSEIGREGYVIEMM